MSTLRRLEVAVDDALAMGVAHRLDHGDEVGHEREPLGQRPRLAGDLRQRAPGDQLHGVERLPRRPAPRLVQVDDGRVLQPRGDDRLALEAGGALRRVLDELLDGDHAAEPAVTRRHDAAHPAARHLVAVHVVIRIDRDQIREIARRRLDEAATALTIGQRRLIVAIGAAVGTGVRPGHAVPGLERLVQCRRPAPPPGFVSASALAIVRSHRRHLGASDWEPVTATRIGQPLGHLEPGAVHLEVGAELALDRLQQTEIHGRGAANRRLCARHAAHGAGTGRRQVEQLRRDDEGARQLELESPTAQRHQLHLRRQPAGHGDAPAVLLDGAPARADADRLRGQHHDRARHLLQESPGDGAVAVHVHLGRKLQRRQPDEAAAIHAEAVGVVAQVIERAARVGRAAGPESGPVAGHGALDADLALDAVSVGRHHPHVEPALAVDLALREDAAAGDLHVAGAAGLDVKALPRAALGRVAQQGARLATGVDESDRQLRLVRGRLADEPAGKARRRCGRRAARWLGRRDIRLLRTFPGRLRAAREHGAGGGRDGRDGHHTGGAAENRQAWRIVGHILPPPYG